MGWAFPFTTLNTTDKVVRCLIHQNVCFHGSSGVIIFLFLLPDVGDRALVRCDFVTFEEDIEQMAGGLTSSSKFLNYSFDFLVDLDDVRIAVPQLRSCQCDKVESICDWLVVALVSTCDFLITTFSKQVPETWGLSSPTVYSALWSAIVTCAVLVRVLKMHLYICIESWATRF
jgi:hypothetical protein